ncbi:MAG: hypothetical protein J6Y02_14560 [Pseudobutyrivibrio sp.]|nr:hypothetical protein [Pseudobutyrivibrio sp.]
MNITKTEQGFLDFRYAGQSYESIMTIEPENNQFKEVYILPISDTDNVEIVAITIDVYIKMADAQVKTAAYVFLRNTYNKAAGDTVIDFYQNVLKLSVNTDVSTAQQLVKLIVIKLKEKGDDNGREDS